MATRSSNAASISRSGELVDRFPGDVARRSDFALLPHRLLVPQPDVIAVRVLQLGAVAPEGLLRRMAELHAGRDELAMLGLDVVDLERQDAARPPRPSGRFGEEQREAELVLHR